jgi:DNA-3-methyladenine glycosylase I
MAEIPAWTPASKALARELKGYGFAFTGPVTVYAAFQACGIVDDHLRDCFRRGAYRGRPAEYPGP